MLFELRGFTPSTPEPFYLDAKRLKKHQGFDGLCYKLQHLLYRAIQAVPLLLLPKFGTCGLLAVAYPQSNALFVTQCPSMPVGDILRII
jgi:hypothetical protein